MYACKLSRQPRITGVCHLIRLGKACICVTILLKIVSQVCHSFIVGKRLLSQERQMCGCQHYGTRRSKRYQKYIELVLYFHEVDYK